MNKLFAFLTLCGLAVFVTGCGEEKPAGNAKPVMPANMQSGNVPGAMNPSPPEDKKPEEGAANAETKSDENAADKTQEENKDEGADENDKEE